MKKLWFLTVILCAVFSMNAQDETVKIKYKETLFMGDNMNIPPQFAQNMPKSWDSNKILYATEAKSIYVVNTEDEDPMAGNEMGRRWGGRNFKEEIFTDLDKEEKYTYTQLFGKEFLIMDSLKTTAWKLHSGAQRDILGFTCIKATFMQDTTEVTGWFTTQLPYSFGPAGYGGLPGVILALSMGENRVYLATEVDEAPAQVPPIEKAKKGDAVTRAEFEKIAEAKRKEMQQMYGRGQRTGSRNF